jgi:two-component system, LytTR family, sensor kinase
MKKILLFFALNIITVCSFGQINLEDYSTSYNGSTNELSPTPMLIIARLNNEMYTAGIDSKDAYPHLRNFEIEKQLDDVTVFNAEDSSEVYFFVNGIYKNNAQDYEFRVTENLNKIIIPWSTPNQFLDDSIQLNMFKKGMANLGGYKTTWNNYLIVDIRRKGAIKPIETMAVYWQQIKPRLLNIYFTTDLNDFFSKMKKSYDYRLSNEEKAKWAAKYPENEIDTNTFLPKKLILDPNENNIIFYLKASIFSKTAIEYQVYKANKILIDWQANEYDNNFIWLKNLEHGEYILKMRLKIQRHNITEYPFKIKPEWYQTGRFQMILGAIIGLFIILLFLLFKILNQKRLLKKEQTDRERADNELKSIRSQLNPHFIFNALNSIQGLMNKNELTQANYYLTEFSKLLRESLLSHEKENVPLSKELKNLETYIKLEQLRFPFKYTFEIDNQLDTNAIEIPYLLLQPIVENAIKHGISNMYEKGEIGIQVYPKNKDLIVLIKDNGKGFNEANTEGGNSTGFGLKLTKQRIQLMNKANKEQTVLLQINNFENKGTNVHWTFKNWL